MDAPELTEVKARLALAVASILVRELRSTLSSSALGQIDALFRANSAEDVPEETRRAIAGAWLATESELAADLFRG